VVAISFYEKLPHKVSRQSPTVSGAAKVVSEGTVGGVANPSGGKGVRKVAPCKNTCRNEVPFVPTGHSRLDRRSDGASGCSSGVGMAICHDRSSRRAIRQAKGFL